MLNKRSDSNSLVVWRLLDGKAGHENQSLGLVQAIQKRYKVKVLDLSVGAGTLAWLHFLAGIWPAGKGLPKPDIIMGAGHATHGHILAAKRAYGGKSVCIMQPTIPAELFDVCLIPEHDQYRGFASYIETRGVINHIGSIAPENKDSQRALIMVGGPSKHFYWDELGVVAQVYDLLRRHADINFVLTTSRRTPASFVTAMQRVSLPNLDIVPFEDTASGWVQNTLASVSAAWVTEDSVSMVYEALTAQVAVGLINLEAKRPSRVSNGIEKLADRQLVTRYDPYGVYLSQMRPVLGFNEASRCGDLLMAHFYRNEMSARLVSRLS